MITKNNSVIDFTSQESDSKVDTFSTLYSLNVNDMTETKQGLTYLSWASALSLFSKYVPDFTYEIHTNPLTGLPYWADPAIGFFVKTSVTAESVTRSMTLPVLDSANKAMKAEPYQYQVFDSKKNQYISKTVQAADAFAINRSILRCLVKNLALFGLGLYLYQGEDFPSSQITEEQVQAPQMPAAPTPQPTTTRRSTRGKAASQQDRYAGIKAAIASVKTMDELVSLFNQHLNEIQGNPEIKTLFSARKLELLQMQVA